MESAKNTWHFEHPHIMTSIWYIIAVCGLYLGFVTLWGPKFMKHRKPYELKKVIIGHNIVQVVSCIYVVYEIIKITESTILFFWKCNAVDESYERLKRHYNLSYLLFWLKISELLETVIFVLRKKQNQVSLLHVFHHVSTITLIYLLINWNKNNLAALFPIFLNSIVHIVMYSYYLIAAVADKRTLRALTPVKKSITIMQMVQFLFIIAAAGTVMIKCGVPRPIFLYFLVVIMLMLYGFYDFYQKSYKKTHSRKR